MDDRDLVMAAEHVEEAIAAREIQFSLIKVKRYWTVDTTLHFFVHKTRALHCIYFVLFHREQSLSPCWLDTGLASPRPAVDLKGPL